MIANTDAKKAPKTYKTFILLMLLNEKKLLKEKGRKNSPPVVNKTIVKPYYTLKPNNASFDKISSLTIIPIFSFSSAGILTRLSIV